MAEEAATREFQLFGGSEALDEPYLQISPLRMVKKRAGWLVVLFLGEMLTATAMGFFEKEIARAVVLALFVPLIISSGGNLRLSGLDPGHPRWRSGTWGCSMSGVWFVAS